MQRRGGIIQVQVNGEVYRAKGSFSYNLGRPKRESIIGSDSVHGYKETPQPAFIEGEITDGQELDLDALVTLKDATVTLDLAIGKMIVMHESFYAGEGTGNTDEGNIGFRVEGRGEEVPA